MCLKKEKSRNAARHRRGKENEEFYSLAKLIPIADGTSSQLDKASIIRLTMSDLQLHNCFFGKFVFIGAQQDFYRSHLAGDFGKIELNSRSPLPSSEKKESKPKAPEEITGLMAVQSVDGFVFIIDENGVFSYISEAVSQYLGMSPHDLMGYPISNFIHDDDTDEFRSKFLTSSKSLSLTSAASSGNEEEAAAADDSLCCAVRMKCPLNKRGTMAKCHGYQVMFLSGHRVTQSYKRLPHIKSTTTTSRPPNDDDDIDENETCHAMYFGFAQTLPQVMLSFDHIDEQSFVIRLDHSFRISYCEEQLTCLLGYKLKEVLGKTLYQFIHPNDLHRLRDCHQETLQKTQSRLQSYRWLLNGGDTCAWLESSFAAIIDKNNSDEQSFVCHSQFIHNEETRVETATVDRAARKKSASNIPNITSITSSSLKRRHSEMAFSEVNSPFATSSENTNTDDHPNHEESDDGIGSDDGTRGMWIDDDFNYNNVTFPISSEHHSLIFAGLKRKSNVLSEDKTDEETEETHQQPAAKQRKSPDEDATSSSSGTTRVRGSRWSYISRTPNTITIKTEPVNHPDDCIIVTVPSSPTDEEGSPLRITSITSASVTRVISPPHHHRQQTTFPTTSSPHTSSPHTSAEVTSSSSIDSTTTMAVETLPLNLSTTPKHHRRSNSSDGSTCSGGYKSRRNYQPRSFSSSHVTDDWTNPPNEDIPVTIGSPAATVPLLLIHHYPFGGIKNPRLAKMIAAPDGGGYPDHMCVAGVAPPRRSSSHHNTTTTGASASFQIVTSIPPPTSSSSSSSSSSSFQCDPPTCSLDTIVDELRKNPMRKVNPPNKVLLPTNKQSQYQAALLKEQERRRRATLPSVQR